MGGFRKKNLAWLSFTEFSLSMGFRPQEPNVANYRPTTHPGELGCVLALPTQPT